MEITLAGIAYLTHKLKHTPPLSMKCLLVSGETAASRKGVIPWLGPNLGVRILGKLDPNSSVLSWRRHVHLGGVAHHVLHLDIAHDSTHRFENAARYLGRIGAAAHGERVVAVIGGVREVPVHVLIQIA